MHHLFEQLAASPHMAAAPAVLTDRHGAISFAELDARANQLARHLARRGIGPGDVVALIFPRCAESYVAILAVLKLHAAYVPLDAAFPPDRVAYICEDATVSLILTTSELSHLCDGAPASAFFIDGNVEAIRRENNAPLDPTRFGPPVSELAYIIYTSGSTGRPKGVPIEHASIVNFVRVAAQTYGYVPGDRVYQGLTLAFDFSVEEVWVPLLAGATLVPNESGANLIGDELAAFMKERRITALCCVPTLLAAMECDLPDLRLLIVSGEACPTDLVRRWHRPGRTILNAYGPTETTVTCTVARLTPDEPVTIGGPLPTYTILIVDPQTLHPLPKGQVGEIVIGGIGVSPGYLNRPEQTRKAFLEDVFGLPHNSSGRIYRSGDLGRIDDQGRVEYLGRIDTQIKIRGYRIEVTEIESQIMQIEGIAQAVVAKHAPEPGLDELAAYYTLADGVSLAEEEIAAALGETLPAYMVPTWYTRLDAMPMMASDKADRKALPPPSHRLSSGTGGKGVAPETEAEARLAAMLGELMGCEPVGVTDNFFDDIGANSLIMARFSTRLRKETQYGPVAMRDFYDNPTIRALARILDDAPSQAAQVLAPNRRVAFTRAQAWRTGALQILTSMAYGAVFVWAGFYAISWTFQAQAPAAIYGHAVVASAALLFSAWLTPVALKWVLVGRMTEMRYQVYTLKYVRYWFVKALIQTNPMNFFAGTPLYNLYLNLLGARVALSAVVLAKAPLMPDLVKIGARSVVSSLSDISAYRVEGGEIVTGRIEIGDDAFVGVGATLDHGTRIEDGGELGHASALYDGQCVPAGEAWHGIPARPAPNRFRRVPHGAPSTARMWFFSLAGLVVPILVAGPLGIWLFHLVYETERNAPIEAAPVLLDFGGFLMALPEIAAAALVLFLAGILFEILRVMILPRLARPFLREGTAYPLYGIRHWLIRLAAAGSNSKFLNDMLGDSVLITGYLSRLGYQFDRIFQTGSNFGTTQSQDYPFLCSFGDRAMASDGIHMANAEYSGNAVRLGETRFGAHTYLGNKLAIVPGARLGENVLIGTKTAIPLDGRPRENTGLLGSPAFQIPRSVERDRQFARYDEDEPLRRARLALKTRHNLLTIAGFLVLRGSQTFIALAMFYTAQIALGLWAPQYFALTGLAVLVTNLAVAVLAERLALGFGRLRPSYCSVYDPDFWRVERVWKLGMSTQLNFLAGTPFRPPILRLLGVEVGKGVFDDGVTVTEKTLAAIGDHVTLNRDTLLQSHSLEDGVFKSDRIVVGSGVTLEPHAFIHYGVTIGDGAWIAPDSFVMKGETVEPGAWWQGNPAASMVIPFATPEPAHPALTAQSIQPIPANIDDPRAGPVPQPMRAAARP